MRITYCCLFFITNVLLYVVGDIFSALVDFTKAQKAQVQLSQSIRNYVKAEQERLAKLSELAARLDTDGSTLSATTVEEYLGNPLNGFFLLSDFATDWEKQLEELTKPPLAHDVLTTTVAAVREDMPGEEDLQGATEALLRLQETYNIPTAVMAKGTVSATANNTRELTAAECASVGYYAFDKESYYRASTWLRESISQLDRDATGSIILRKSLLDYLSFALYKQGHYHEGLAFTNELLTIEPDDQRFLDNKRHFEVAIENNSHPQNLSKGDRSSKTEPEVLNSQHTTAYYNRRLQYQALCRGEDVVPIPDQHKLHCRYYIPHPMFIIAPIKEEVFSFDPLVRVWYDILHDNEIEQFKQLAMPRLNRATAYNFATKRYEPAHYRISKSAWLRDDLDVACQTINQRITAITNLTIESAEELQVVNYGLGGQYEPHFDFSRRHERDPDVDQRGNRIATLLFYMSDVEAGGATVFTTLGLKVTPRRGSALFWYNLRRTGDGDLRTQHAACPVLQGSKWVMNKWFHEAGQDQARPCALDRKE